MTTAIAIAILVAATIAIHLLLRRREHGREREAALALADIAALGDEAVPASLHPIVDPVRCIGSGACVSACPEKNVLGLVGGRAVLTNPLACIGHGACYEACPVDAIKLVFGSANKGVELPKVDADYHSNQAGVYVIGELSGMGLIRNAVRQGALAANHLVRSSRRGTGDALDAVVVGAGPAGISATLRLIEGGLRVLLIEREAFGGTIMHYPRAKVVMTGTLDLPAYGKVKRRTMSKEQLVALWEDIRTKTQLPVVTGELVERVSRAPDGMWEVATQNGVRRAASVMLALGRRGSPRKLDVPGEDLPKVTYRLLEPDPFRGQDVLVVGGGNSAVECALALADAGFCKSVSLSYRRAQFGRCRAENRRRIDEAIRLGRVRAVLPSQVSRIGPHDVALQSEGKTLTLPNDAVIVQIGGTAPTELLASFGVQMVTKHGEA